MTKDATNRRSGMKTRGAPTPLTEEEALRVAGAGEGEDHGYDGALTVEFVVSIDRTPANRHPNAVETEPTDITPEQKKFIEDHGSNLLSDEFYTMLTRRSAEVLLPLIR